MKNRAKTITQIKLSDIVSAAMGLAFLLQATPSSFAVPPMQPQRKMGEPLPGLTASQFDRWEKGRTAYTTPLTTSEGVGPFFGLGPVFNKSNCANCHNNPTGATGAQSVTRFGVSDKGTFDPLEQFGGSLQQEAAISAECLETLPDVPNLVTSFRVTNGVLAYGLAEAIPGAALLANRDWQIANHPDLQGVAHMVSNFEDDARTPPNSHVGRFGWKAQVATMTTFSADASFNELGMTNVFLTDETDPNGINPPSLKECDDGVADPDDVDDAEGFTFNERVTDFQRFLGPAPQTPKSGMTGEVIFDELRCSVCHTPSFTTEDNPNLEDAIRNKTIRPYSDFLLHDMGLSSDFIVQGQGTEQLMKTQPLSGLYVRKNNLWHTGLINGDTHEEAYENAIMMHDGGVLSQGYSVVQEYVALDQADKNLLLDFLKSLGRPEFDMFYSLEQMIDVNDFNALAACYTGENVPYAGKGENPMDLPCAVSDIDQDGDIDVDDLASFMVVYIGARRDCNENGIVDLLEIADGTLVDADFNAIPDSCEPTCDQDTNGTGGVDVDDLLTVINGWGDCQDPPAPCAGDLTLNLTVDVDDLLALINAWGPCQ